MKKTVIALAAISVCGLVASFVAPINAQQRAQPTCQVGDNSGAACYGKWIYFAGNTSGVDSGAWVVRMNGETGEIWYKNGKRFVLLEEPNR